MDPAVTTKRAPPPGRLGSRITQTPDAYVIGHFGIARVTGPDWSLRVDGLVGNVLQISLPQLRALPSVTVTAVLECFGNPLQPAIPVRRAANVRWRGVLVRALLDAAGARSRASIVWARGLDSGRFDGIDCACYLKDLPLSWQQFSADRHFGPGDYRILARATDRRGRVQPRASARNQTHSVSLRVRGDG
jgi:DMSO/TMAO reductase YedYZ molybdopterin-dependent catalytic subunit